MSSLTKIQSFDGNVGIGTTNPGTDKLKVYGGSADFAGVEVSSLTVGAVTNAYMPIGSIMIWSGAADSESIPQGWKLCNGDSHTRSDGGGSITTPDLRDKFVIAAISAASGTYSAGTTGGTNSKVLQETNIYPHTHNTSTDSSSNHTHTLNAAEIPSHTHQLGAGGDHNGHNINPYTGSHSHELKSAGAHEHQIGNSGAHSHQLNIVDTRIGFGFRDYSRTSGSWTAHGPIKSSTDGQNKTRTEDSSVGNHNHQVNNVAGHVHPTPLGNHPTSQTQHTHTVTNDDSHSHACPSLTSTHSHGMGPGGSHTHTVNVGNAGSSSSLSLLPPYYVLAYVMKI